MTILESEIACRQVTEVDCALVCSDFVTELKSRAMLPIFRQKDWYANGRTDAGCGTLKRFCMLTRP